MRRFLIVLLLFLLPACLAAQSIEPHIQDRVDSSQKWKYEDLLSASGSNSITLAGTSASDSSAYYVFYQTTAIAFLVSAADNNVTFSVIAESCRPVAGDAASYRYYSPIDTLVVASAGYMVWPVQDAAFNEYIRFRFVSDTGNGAATVISRMRLNRSWP